MASSREVLGWDPTSKECPVEHWLPVEVPTTVQSALVHHGRTPFPWRDWNIRALESVESEPWWFRHLFELPEDHAQYDAWELHFMGVSLFATVWLNGAPVGYIHDAHHAQVIDITSEVRATGPNVLAMTCGLNLDQVRRSVRPEIRSHADAVRAFMRMPQMSSGWDFAPHMLLVGPWRPVLLVGHRKASIEDALVRTQSIEGEGARLRVLARVRSFGAHATPPRLTLAICEANDASPVWSQSVDVHGDGTVEIPVVLPSPRLWSPRPLGEPFLYVLKAQVECDGEVVDNRITPFGIRTVELLTEDRFTFLVNGQEVFAKGANWVPSNALTWDATDEHYRHLIELAAGAHFNMFRIWGGGIYESDTFYDLCDQLGIMVWQDFMFSNTRVPDDDPVFMERVEREIRTEVTRLRKHPCLALWCGNNECLEAWAAGEWPGEAARHFGERVYFSVLPRIVARLSPDVPYWPGSPYGGATTRSLDQGDFHDWTSLPDWRAYDRNAPRFSSEYGCRAVPQRETVDAMISPEFQWEGAGFLHTAWRFHHGWCDSMKEMLREFGEPQSLEEYILLTQEMQATVMRYAVEVYRRRMYATSGSLIWQYNEPWPAVTFSLVDFFGRPKASYYWVRKAYAPVLGMFHSAEGRLSYWGVNDLRQKTECHVHMRRFHYSGALLGEVSWRGVLPPNTATRMCDGLPDALQTGASAEEFLYAELRWARGSSEHEYHSAFRKDWRLPHAELSATCQRVNEETLRLEVSSSGYVHFVAVSVEDPCARFSDNFFDLLSHEPRVVEIRTRGRGPVKIRSANAHSISVGSSHLPSCAKTQPAVNP